MAEVCALCNDARIDTADGAQYRAIGQPTEAALLVLTEKLGVPGVCVCVRVRVISCLCVFV